MAPIREDDEKKSLGLALFCVGSLAAVDLQAIDLGGLKGRGKLQGWVRSRQTITIAQGRIS
ncbi:hypothetical protein BIU82_18465 [Arthrobacter sp. SW1]|nr:hypothetical protein BIU82_18465 [Arthrobacter sp. SW1]